MSDDAEEHVPATPEREAAGLLRLICEALDTVAIPSTRDRIFRLALELSGLDELPPDIDRLRTFVKVPLRAVIAAELGEDVAEQVLATGAPALQRSVPPRSGVRSSLGQRGPLDRS